MGLEVVGIAQACIIVFIIHSIPHHVRPAHVFFSPLVQAPGWMHRLIGWIGDSGVAGADTNWHLLYESEVTTRFELAHVLNAHTLAQWLIRSSIHAPPKLCHFTALPIGSVVFNIEVELKESTFLPVTILLSFQRYC